MTPNRRPRFLALTSSRGSTRKPPPALCTALGDDLLVVPAKTRPGTVAPDDTDRAAARRNLIRKQIQLPWLFGQPWVERLYLAHKARQSARLRRMLSTVLASHPGILPMIWNGTKLPQSALAAATDPGWRLFMENGYFRGTMQIDPKGVNDHNSLPRDPEFYRGYATVHKAVQESPELIRRQTKHTTHRAVDLPANYVFVPFQVDFDMQITELSPWISSMREFHDVLVAVAESRDGPVLVIKEHPGSRHTLHDRVPRHPRIVFQNGRDTGELIDGAAAVMTINSTVGIEALSRGAKVLVLGECCYDVPRMVRRARSVGELADILATLDDWVPDDEVRSGFIAYLAREFLFRCDPFDEDLAQRLLALPTRDHRDILRGTEPPREAAGGSARGTAAGIPESE